MNKKNMPGKLLVKQKEKSFVINMNDIVYLKSKNNYTKILLTNNVILLATSENPKYRLGLNEILKGTVPLFRIDFGCINNHTEHTNAPYFSVVTPELDLKYL